MAIVRLAIFEQIDKQGGEAGAHQAGGYKTVQRVVPVGAAAVHENDDRGGMTGHAQFCSQRAPGGGNGELVFHHTKLRP